MAHSRGVETVTKYQTADGTVFDTLEQARAYEDSLAAEDSFKEFRKEITQELKDRNQKAQDVLNDLNKVGNELSKAERTRNDALATLNATDKADEDAYTAALEAYKTANEDYDQKLAEYAKVKGKYEDILVSDIEKAVYSGVEMADSNANAYQNLKTFIFTDTTKFFEIVGNFANAKKIGEVRVDFEDTFFGVTALRK